MGEAIRGREWLVEEKAKMVRLYHDFKIADKVVKQMEAKLAAAKESLQGGVFNASEFTVPGFTSAMEEAQQNEPTVEELQEQEFTALSWLQQELAQMQASIDNKEEYLPREEIVSETPEYSDSGPKVYPKAKTFPLDEKELMERYESAIEKVNRIKKERRAAIIDWEEEFRSQNNGQDPTIADRVGNMKLFTDYQAANNAVRRLQRQLASAKLRLKDRKSLDDSIISPEIDEILEDEVENLESYSEGGESPTSWLTGMLKEIKSVTISEPANEDKDSLPHSIPINLQVIPGEEMQPGDVSKLKSRQYLQSMDTVLTKGSDHSASGVSLVSKAEQSWKH